MNRVVMVVCKLASPPKNTSVPVVKSNIRIVSSHITRMSLRYISAEVCVWIAKKPVLELCEVAASEGVVFTGLKVMKDAGEWSNF